MRALVSCEAQDFPDAEILVLDDASNDDTVEVVKKKFPQVRVQSEIERRGLIYLRSEGFRLAQGDIVFSLDDDAYFSASDIVTQSVAVFEKFPEVGAVAIPYLEPRSKQSVSSIQNNVRYNELQELSSFRGCAYAVRRTAALEIGKYRDFFVHQGEERDFCIRLRNSGWRIVYGTAGHVVHIPSSNRDEKRMIFYGCRNIVLFDYLNIPWPAVMFRLIWDPIAITRYRFSWGTLPLKLKGMFSGLSEAWKRRGERNPVSSESYAAFRRLPGHGPENVNEPLPKPVALRRV